MDGSMLPFTELNLYILIVANGEIQMGIYWK